MTHPGNDQAAPGGLHKAEPTEPGGTGDDVPRPTTPYDDGTDVQDIDEYGAESGGYGVDVGTG